jgi:hypothetical protein
MAAQIPSMAVYHSVGEGRQISSAASTAIVAAYVAIGGASTAAVVGDGMGGDGGQDSEREE